jgi:hypothetical protein
MSQPIKPGTDNQRPGRYVEVGPRGGHVDDPRVIHIDPGDRLPPTSKPGNCWKKN